MRNIVFIAIALVLAIAATVLAFIFIVPEKRREKLGAFGKFLHDACTFKFLLVEKILQALYIFSTAFIVLYGVFLLFNVEYSYWGGTHWTGGVGLLCILLGPILIRLSYELMMMAILLLKMSSLSTASWPTRPAQAARMCSLPRTWRSCGRRPASRRQCRRPRPIVPTAASAVRNWWTACAPNARRSTASSAARSWSTESAPSAAPPPTTRPRSDHISKKRNRREAVSLFASHTYCTSI